MNRLEMIRSKYRTQTERELNGEIREFVPESELEVQYLLSLLGTVVTDIQKVLVKVDKLDEEILYDACKTYTKDELIKEIRKTLLSMINP